MSFSDFVSSWLLAKGELIAYATAVGVVLIGMWFPYEGPRPSLWSRVKAKWQARRVKQIEVAFNPRVTAFKQFSAAKVIRFEEKRDKPFARCAGPSYLTRSSHRVEPRV